MRHALCAEQDRKLVVIGAVVEDVVDEGPLGYKADAAADKYDVFTLGFFYRVCAFAERASYPDFVADSQPVNGVGDIADSADDQLEVALLRGR